MRVDRQPASPIRALSPLLITVALATAASLAACGGGGGGGSGQGGGGGAGPGGASGPSDAAQVYEETAFDEGGRRVVPMDIESHSLKLSFDAASERATGVATIRFQVRQPGQPMLLMTPAARVVRLDGKDTSLAATQPPSGGSSVQVLADAVAPGASHELVVEYDVDADDVTFVGGGARFGIFMDDNQGFFLNRYAPANFEFDQYALTVELAVSGGSGSHRVFANGETSGSGNAFKVDFPAHFNSSAPYLHLTNEEMQVTEDAYVSAGGVVPVTVYSKSGEDNASAMSRAKSALADMESSYGAYSHGRMLIYIAPPGGNISGMEYSGATISQLVSVSHEVSHSWFARGVMPASAGDGWMDEAIATWRDLGYSRGSGAERSPVNLAGLSAFALATPEASYTSGERFMRDLDYAFANQGGLRSLLKGLYAEKNHQVITTGQFRSFLEQKTQATLAPLFDRYAYGKNVTTKSARIAEAGRTGDDAQVDSAETEPTGEALSGPGPRATEEQLAELR